jgi:DNA gyrase subunit B
MYLKNQAAFDDHILQLATDKLRLLGSGGGKEVAGSRLAAQMRRVHTFERLLGRLQRRHYDARVLRTIALHLSAEPRLLHEAPQAMQLQQQLLAALQRQYGEIVQDSQLIWDEEHNCYRIVVLTRENGSTLTTTIDHVLLASQDFQGLRDLARQLEGLGAPPYVLQYGGVETVVEGFDTLLQTVNIVGKKDLNIQRYKGLGEMNPIQLWETTMDPERRTLLQVTIEDAVEADYIFTTLMGDQVDPRKAFIEKHAKEVVNLDV